MPMFRLKSSPVEAHQWFKNGDHPMDNDPSLPEPEILGEGRVVEYFMSPDGKSCKKCGNCGHQMSEHGWVMGGDIGHIVCPGDWLITGFDGFYPLKPYVFETMYEAIE